MLANDDDMSTTVSPTTPIIAPSEFESKPIWQTPEDGVLVIYALVMIGLYVCLSLAILILRKSERDFKRKIDALRASHESHNEKTSDKQVFDTSFTPEDDPIDLDDEEDYLLPSAFSLDGPDDDDDGGGGDIIERSMRRRKSMVASKVFTTTSTTGAITASPLNNPLRGRNAGATTTSAAAGSPSAAAAAIAANIPTSPRGGAPSALLSPKAAKPPMGTKK